jgi:hypothetical protein
VFDPASGRNLTLGAAAAATAKAGGAAGAGAAAGLAEADLKTGQRAP